MYKQFLDFQTSVQLFFTFFIMHEGKALKNAAKTSQIGVTGLADALKIPRLSIYYQLKSENLEEDFKTDALNVLGLKYEQVFGQRGPA